MLTVLSPHRDDAAFCLTLTLRELLARGRQVQIINVATRSAYAPHCDAEGVEAVSATRQMEDQRFTRRMGDNLGRVDLERLDAPLRGDYDDGGFMHRRPFDAAEEAEVQAVAALLAALSDSDVFFVPLAFGDHVDHRIAQAAAHVAWPRDKLAYYEDLPYACGAPDDIEAHARRICPASVPVLLGGTTPVHAKFEALRDYRSQATMGDVAAMLAHAKGYGWAEQVWLAKGDMLG